MVVPILICIGFKSANLSIRSSYNIWKIVHIQQLRCTTLFVSVKTLMFLSLVRFSCSTENTDEVTFHANMIVSLTIQKLKIFTHNPAFKRLDIIS